MEPITKLLIGGAATTLLAWGSHALTGAGYVHSLEHASDRALSEGGVVGVEAGMRSDGGLSRTVVLSGNVPAETRQQAEDSLGEVDGLRQIVWADEIEGSFAVDGGEFIGGSAGGGVGQVTACQASVDEALDGQTINFRSGSAYMNDESNAKAQLVADALKGCEGLRIEIGGHTNDAGSESVNQLMSQERADRVAASLTERGIAADRITATGFGESKPMADIDGADPANRRIEFTVLPTASTGVAADITAEGAE